MPFWPKKNIKLIKLFFLSLITSCSEVDSVIWKVDRVVYCAELLIQNKRKRKSFIKGSIPLLSNLARRAIDSVFFFSCNTASKPPHA